MMKQVSNFLKRGTLLKWYLTCIQHWWWLVKAVALVSATRVTLKVEINVNLFQDKLISVSSFLETWNRLSEWQITFLQYVADRVAVVDDWVRGVVSLDDQIVRPVPISKESPLLSANCRKCKKMKHWQTESWKTLHGLKLTMSSPRPELGLAKRALPLMLPYPVLRRHTYRRLMKKLQKNLTLRWQTRWTRQLRLPRQCMWRVHTCLQLQKKIYIYVGEDNPWYLGWVGSYFNWQKKVRLRDVLTWQILIELKHVRVFIPLPQVCVFVEIGHTWWSCSIFFMFCNLICIDKYLNHVYIPMTYSGQRPARTIKAEEKWREERSKRIGRPIFWSITKLPLSWCSCPSSVWLCTDGRSLPLSAVAMAEKRSLVGEAPQAWRCLTSYTLCPDLTSVKRIVSFSTIRYPTSLNQLFESLIDMTLCSSGDVPYTVWSERCLKRGAA